MNNINRIVDKENFVPAQLPSNQDIIKGLLTFEDEKSEVVRSSDKLNLEEKETSQGGSNDSSTAKTVSAIS